jgi:hypothetical protein
MALPLLLTATWPARIQSCGMAMPDFVEPCTGRSTTKTYGACSSMFFNEEMLDVVKIECKMAERCRGRKVFVGGGYGVGCAQNPGPRIIIGTDVRHHRDRATRRIPADLGDGRGRCCHTKLQSHRS